MAKAKLTPEMKKFIEKNIEMSNRFLSARITENFKVKVSHVIVGRYKNKAKFFRVETPVETPIEQIEPIEQKQKIRKIKRVTAEKMVENIIITKVNRGMSNERILELAKFVVDQIYEDCLNTGN